MGQGRSNCPWTPMTPEGFAAFSSAARVQEGSGYRLEIHKVLLGKMDFAPCFLWVGNTMFPESYISSENFSNAKRYCPALYNVQLKLTP